MNIACIGNMNNMMFPLTRYLADAGHTVTLFLLDEYEHFLPSADVFVNDERIKIVELGWHHQNFFQTSSTQVKKIFEGFDFRIGTDYAPAYLLKARMTLDIFFPSGGDVFDYPYRKVNRTSFLPKIHQIEEWRCTKYQKLSLSLSNYLSMDQANSEMEKYLFILKMDKIERITALPFLYMPQYNDEYFKNSKFHNLTDELRKNNDFLIIQHCRQSWACDINDLHYKANDLLIKGFSLFLKRNTTVRSKLILLEYGVDVQKSKNLIDDLKISEQIIWLPKMLRRDLIAIIKECDVGVGELGRSWLSYCAVFEILAMKVPFIGNRNDSDFIDKVPNLYSMYNATTTEDILNALTEINNGKETATIKAQQGYEWFIKNAIKKSIDKILTIIENKNSSNQKSINLNIRIKSFFIDIVTNFIILLNKLKLKANKLFSLFRYRG